MVDADLAADRGAWRRGGGRRRRRVHVRLRGGSRRADPSSRRAWNRQPPTLVPEDLESSLAFVSAAASDLSFDEARAVDLAPAPRIVESAIERLTNAAARGAGEVDSRRSSEHGLAMNRLVCIVFVVALAVPAATAQDRIATRPQAGPAQQTPPPEPPAGRRAGREGRANDVPPGLRADEVQQIVDGWEIATAEKTLRAERSAVRAVHPAAPQTAEWPASAVHAAPAHADQAFVRRSTSSRRPTTPRSMRR